MDIVKSYLVDEAGNIKNVVVDYQTFRKIEEALLDVGLGKAMEEVADDEEIDLETAKRIAGFKDERPV
jgi:hypothetical protein